MCRTTCGGDGDCTSGLFCYGGACTKRPDGAVCAAHAECQSTACGGAASSTHGRCCAMGTSCSCTQPGTANKIVNAGFDTNLSGWTVYDPPTGSSSIKWLKTSNATQSDAEACPYSGSLEIYQFGSNDQPYATQCLSVTASTAYNFGAAVRNTASGIGFCAGVYCELRWFSAASCAGTDVSGVVPPRVDSSSTGWTKNTPFVNITATSPATAASAQIKCGTFYPAQGQADCWGAIDMVYLSLPPATY
jgi:hypothetical protein